MSLRRERREKSESVHDRDEDRLPDLGILWEQAGRRGGAAGLEDDEGESWSDRKSWTWQKWCLLASVFVASTCAWDTPTGAASRGLTSGARAVVLLRDDGRCAFHSYLVQE